MPVFHSQRVFLLLLFKFSKFNHTVACVNQTSILCMCKFFYDFEIQFLLLLLLLLLLLILIHVQFTTRLILDEIIL